MERSEDVPLFCHRCGRILIPGKGNFYVVRIEACADPTPPDLDAGELDGLDMNEEFSRLIEEMREMSERELMDQVYRRMIVHLCGSCYRVWIEDPAGSPD